ncbi:MAG: acetylxylan esterase [Verrucomicrobia bacterium]|nr:acetylxylan esterase [Prolixibacteraceae bacterium]
MKKLNLLLILCILLSGYISMAQNQIFELKQSNATGIYKKGEKIRVYAFVTTPATDSLQVIVRKNNDQVVSNKAYLPAADSILIYEGSSSKPCSFMVETKLKEQKKGIGMIVDPYKLKPGTKYPKGLNAYWEKEKKELKALPLDVKFGKNESSDYVYVCFDTEINCTGPKPARGYFAMPFKAAPKSLPIVLLVHAAGVKGSWCKSKPEEALKYAKMGKGALVFDLNAHGMLNGQPDEYYNQLEAGELKDYYIQGLESKEDIYFRGMYLRLMRTLDFITTLPEWDGQRILVIGESQGGGQALAAAGLDKRVSAVVATVPAMCDWGGTLVGRKGGWPQLFERAGDKQKMMKTLPYFDTAHLLRNSKATIVVEVGLIDNTCPSTSIYAAINQAKGKVIVYPVPYREHSWPAPADRPHWDKNVFGPKNAFVESYLK